MRGKEVANREGYRGVLCGGKHEEVGTFLRLEPREEQLAN